jgi:hypothetical protein
MLTLELMMDLLRQSQEYLSNLINFGNDCLLCIVVSGPLSGAGRPRVNVHNEDDDTFYGGDNNDYVLLSGMLDCI